MATWSEVSARAGRNDMPTILFYSIMDGRLTDKAQIALGIERAWTGCEWPGITFDSNASGEVSRQAWHSIFMHALETGEFLDETTPRDLTALPEELTLYRGAPESHKIGMSWTTDFERAHWFATRMNVLFGGGKVYRITIPRDWVLAKFHEARSESEYVLDVLDIEDEEIEEVPETEYQKLLTSHSKSR